VTFAEEIIIKSRQNLESPKKLTRLIFRVFKNKLRLLLYYYFGLKAEQWIPIKSPSRQSSSSSSRDVIVISIPGVFAVNNQFN